VIIPTLVVIIGLVLVVGLTRRKEYFMTLEEVIPQGTILSREEGVIEYNEVYYILGTHDLRERKHRLELLNLLDLEEGYTVDLRFDTQVILKRDQVRVTDPQKQY